MTRSIDATPQAEPGMPLMDATARTARIRMLNDMLREGFPTGDVVVTPGVASLRRAMLDLLMIAVQRYDAFSPDNDPFCEHDFGALTFAGERYFWKIDAYDRERLYASPDPADPEVTQRVLTIMRADEY